MSHFNISSAFRASLPRWRRPAFVGVLSLALFAPATTAQQIQPASEAGGFQRFTTHPEMMDYIHALRATSLDMRLGTYGETREGRELPYVIYSRPLISEPWEAALLGRPVVLLAANVHGGERTFREGLLVLMRDLATRGTEANALLDHIVVLVAPQINPDGFHLGNNGQRGNAWGIDLNRDYVKLEHPEIAGYIGNLVNRWQPHAFVDGHNGGATPYNLNYQCPSNAAPDQRITEMCDFGIFPFIDRALAAEGMKSWYYAGGTETRWNTGGAEARIGRNYGGLVNSIGILFEAPGGQNLATGARAGYLGYKAVLDFVQQNSTQVLDLIQTARMETIAWGLAAEGQIPVTMRYGPEDRTVQYELVRNGQIVQVTSDSLIKKPIPIQMRDRPYAYILPREAEAAVAMLRRHNIVVEQLLAPTTLTVQTYTIGDIGYTTQYDHAAAVEVTVASVSDRSMNFPKDTYVVPTGQVLGRLVAHMLEVETDDNVVYWNTMDALLPRPAVRASVGQGGDGESEAFEEQQQQTPPIVPIYKLMTPTPLPTRIVP